MARALTPPALAALQGEECEPPCVLHPSNVVMATSAGVGGQDVAISRGVGIGCLPVVDAAGMVGQSTGKCAVLSCDCQCGLSPLGQLFFVTRFCSCCGHPHN